MWKRYFYLSLAFNIVVIATFVFFAFVLPSANGKTEGNAKNYKYPLTESQQQKLDSLKTAFGNASDTLRIKSIRDRIELWTALTQTPTDTAKIKLAMQRLIDSENQLKIRRYKFYLKEKFVLKPEQRREQITPLIERLQQFLDQDQGSAGKK